MVCGRVVPSLPSRLCQRAVTTVWRPRVHGASFPEVKRIVATLRLGCAHLRALGPSEVSRSLPFPLWGGDVMAYVGPLWEFLEVEEGG